MFRNLDSDYKVIIVGDAAMAPEELYSAFHRILARLLHHDLQTAAIAAGSVHRAVNIQLRLRNVKSGRKLPELAERHLKLPVVQHPVITEIPVFALSNHRKRRLMP